MYHNEFDDASKKMVGKSDEGEMTGVIERESGGSEDERRPTRPKEPDPHSQRTERDSERGEGVIWGGWTSEDPTRQRGTRLPPPTDREGFREGRGGDLWVQMNWRGELVVRVSFGD